MMFERTDGERGAQLRLVSPTLPVPATRIVTLLTLSKEVPAALLGNQLAGALRTETEAPVALLRLQPGEQPATPIKRDYGQATVVDWACSEVVLQNQSIVSPTLLKTPEGFYLVNLSLSEQPLTIERMELLLDQLKRTFRYILLELVAEEIPSTLQRQFLLRSDLIYLFFKPCGEDPSEQDRLLAQIGDRCNQPTAPVRPVTS